MERVQSVRAPTFKTRSHSADEVGSSTGWFSGFLKDGFPNSLWIVYMKFRAL